jgi:hypothetical protein
VQKLVFISEAEYRQNKSRTKAGIKGKKKIIITRIIGREKYIIKKGNHSKQEKRTTAGTGRAGAESALSLC